MDKRFDNFAGGVAVAYNSPAVMRFVNIGTVFLAQFNTQVFPERSLLCYLHTQFHPVRSRTIVTRCCPLYSSIGSSAR